MTTVSKQSETAAAVEMMRKSNAAQDAGRQAEADRLWAQANAKLDSTGRNA
jgi:hypothetical protein